MLRDIAADPPGWKTYLIQAVQGLTSAFKMTSKAISHVDMHDLENMTILENSVLYDIKGFFVYLLCFIQWF